MDISKVGPDETITIEQARRAIKITAYELNKVRELEELEALDLEFWNAYQPEPEDDIREEFTIVQRALAHWICTEEVLRATGRA